MVEGESVPPPGSEPPRGARHGSALSLAGNRISTLNIRGQHQCATGYVNVQEVDDEVIGGG